MKIKQRKYKYVAHGPQEGFWRSEYLLCPYCHVLLEKSSKVSRCKCGNVSIDGDALRISVLVDDSEIPTFNEANPLSTDAISYNQVINAKYTTKIQPKNTFIEKIDLIGTDSLLIMENHINFIGISNLYLLKNKKEIIMQLPKPEDYYVDFSDFGQPFLEAISLSGTSCRIDLKTGECVESKRNT